MGYHQWKSCIDACLECAAVCNHCEVSCTKEENVKMMSVYTIQKEPAHIHGRHFSVAGQAKITFWSCLSS